VRTEHVDARAAQTTPGGVVANPIAVIVSAAMLPRWLAERPTNQALRAAADTNDGGVSMTPDTGVSTSDLDGHSTTNEFTVDVVAALRA